ncbi:hypothetical protein P389DRAFT_180630 [Cystobasidium minutum MCA 4210]|uniref:uncharacterized protein n=1 Tax=Cystobasidium minutum MCA 4210 TaxID=1397322 RepID=UPI0034CF30D0|eukprot:jgi/Rhomi1/180630/fgenesh1_pg.5_\
MAPADKPQQEASTSAAKVAQEANKGEEDAKKTLPQLGALEEDDEFEEVRPDNPSSSSSSKATLSRLKVRVDCRRVYLVCKQQWRLTTALLNLIDWDDSEASLNQITTSIKGKSDSTSNGQANAAGSANDNLWEDNWDDDDIEDDFSVQLRCVSSNSKTYTSDNTTGSASDSPPLLHRKAISEQNGPQDMQT